MVEANGLRCACHGIARCCVVAKVDWISHVSRGVLHYLLMMVGKTMLGKRSFRKLKAAGRILDALGI